MLASIPTWLHVAHGILTSVSLLILIVPSARAAGRSSDDPGLEVCLRELDADQLGLGGFNLGGTMDAAVHVLVYTRTEGKAYECKYSPCIPAPT